ncbi:MAG: hypothetical protein JKY56_12260 [Kofleriaceae bacterium]|nr:hypothetical protein [Kofleriaceae bacterium]
MTTPSILASSSLDSSSSGSSTTNASSPDSTATPGVLRWASIDLFHNVVRTLEFLHSEEGPEHGTQRPRLQYRAKVKLHGTNAAVQRTSGGVFAQSRSRVLTVKDDNLAFAKWVDEQSSYFSQLPPDTTVFGEWCGRGVQKKVAISQIDRRIFAVFAVQIGQGESALLETCPERIKAILPDADLVDMYIIPWHLIPISVDYSASLESAVEEINAMVHAIEQEDPWVKSVFDISGLGEGVVMYPMLASALTPESFSLYAFKAKGEKHRTSKSSKAAQIVPEVAEGVPEFVAMQCTTARFEQGFSEACDNQLNMRSMGGFIKWVTADVKKESEAELEAAGLTWKQVSKEVSTAARQWFKGKCENIR